ncbi:MULTISPECIES: hypothetical protein [unclassified Roseitalea]|uniref:hypothetical protein n=1 Tax=unclassified Roseitalea TaxID=2639107 RepID=UPI00273D69F5|nr:MULTISPECIES: hypothetical protein [unclassified Roseitalea]
MTSRYRRTNKALDLARMMIKQAKLLKNAGLIAEARELARRAIAINGLGHHAARLEPARIAGPRH